MVIKRFYSVVLISIFCMNSLGAASSSKGELCIGTSLEEYQKLQQFSVALRSNDASGVRAVLDETSDLINVRWDGGITPLHVAVAIEYVHGHDPKEVIDALAEAAASHYKYTPIHRRSESLPFYVQDSTKNWPLRALADMQANINHPMFHELCTGESSTSRGVKLLLTPIELAVRNCSVKTLAALVQYMPISTAISKEPNLTSNFELYESIVEHELTKAQMDVEGAAPFTVDIQPYLSPQLREHIVKTFGVEGMQLLHKYDFSLSRSGHLYQLFNRYHPGKNDEIAHLIPVEKSFVDTVRGWFCRF